MSEQLSELPLRYAERILVSSFNHLQLSQRDKIPAFETMPELLKLDPQLAAGQLFKQQQ